CRGCRYGTSRPQSLTRGTREGTVWVASLPVRALGGVVLGACVGSVRRAVWERFWAVRRSVCGLPHDQRVRHADTRPRCGTLGERLRKEDTWPESTTP